MSKFLISRLGQLTPYTPGEQPQDREYIKLNTNESPYPPSPKVLAAISSAEIEALRLYPDPQAKGLVQALAATWGVSQDQVIVANGSDEILAFFFMAFCGGEKPLCFPDITYGFYEVYSSLFGTKASKIPLREDLSIGVEDYLYQEKNIILANPNAPTGLYLPLEAIEEILKANPGHLVLIDEAYIDFGGRSATALLPYYDNLVICGTFSKSRSLAGARLGYALGSPEVIADLNKIKYSFNPYNVNRLTQLAGIAALEDVGYFDKCRDLVVSTREKNAKKLRGLGFEVLDSMTNFLLARHPALPGEDLYLQLKGEGILVRHFNVDRICDYVRITIGTPQEMEELLKALGKILKEAT